MHPEKYYTRTRDEPTEIDLDELGKSELVPHVNRFDNVVGEFGVKVLFTEQLTATQAESAASGWDGDRLVFGGDPEGDYAMAWLSIWDTRRDAVEFAETLVEYFKKQRPDLKAGDTGDGSKARLSDDLGTVAVEDDGERVVCVHARDPKRADALLEALARIAADVERVP